MKHLIFTILLFSAVSCLSVQNIEPEIPSKGYTIYAQKACWSPATKAMNISYDIPWEVGDTVRLIDCSQTIEGCTEYSEWNRRGTPSGNMVIHSANFNLCTVVEVDGMACALKPVTKMKEGTYRAIYPNYTLSWYDYIHISFLYNEVNNINEYPENVMVSNPVTYDPGDTLKFVMNHLCALLNVEINAPKNGKYTQLKLFSDEIVFAGKAEYYLDRKYDVNEIASGWLNYTALQTKSKNMEIASGSFMTSTALLPADFDNIPVCVHLVYEDGTHYVSEKFNLPTMGIGEEMTVKVENFQKTDDDLHGLWGECFKDSKPMDYNNIQ